MDSYCVFGHPIEHSKSPWIQTRFAQLTGQTLQYEKTWVPLDAFSATVHAFRAAGGKGCNVTLPFKTEAASLAIECSPRVALAQACNTLQFDGEHIYGENTDGLGLVTDLVSNAGFSLQGRRILLIGAGGAAAGVLGPLLTQKPDSIWVANRSLDKAIQLVARHASLALAEGVDCQAFGLTHEAILSRSFDLVINASSSSLQQAALPVPASVLQTNGLACDLMYGPAAQGFMQWARAHGTQARDGLGMLVEQAAASFKLWRGVQPPTQEVLADLRALLSQAK
jgi:shikimate dehydrogenase